MTTRPTSHVPTSGWLVLATAVIQVIAGCATVRELTALRHVEFSLDRVSDVRLAGVRVDNRRGYSDLSAIEVGRLTAAVLTQAVPLDLIVHVRAENPHDNPRARLAELDWTLFLEDRETVSGVLSGDHQLPPGEATDVPIEARVDLYDFFRGNARDLFELALALAGQGGEPKEVRIEALPTIQTSLGPIRYPGRIVIRREVGR